MPSRVAAESCRCSDCVPETPTFRLASLGGSAALHSVYTKYDAAAFGRRAAEYVIDLGLDGLDVDLEGWGADPRGAGAAFLGRLTQGARAAFAAADPHKKWVVTHAPEMPDFWHGTRPFGAIAVVYRAR